LNNSCFEPALELCFLSILCVYRASYAIVTPRRRTFPVPLPDIQWKYERMCVSILAQTLKPPPLAAAADFFDRLAAAADDKIIG